MDDINKWCSCPSCRDGQGSCEMLNEMHEHVTQVSELLTEPNQHIVTLLHFEWGTTMTTVRCHSALLCRYSQVFKRLFEHYALDGHVISSINFADVDNMLGVVASPPPFDRTSGFENLVQWCYTGKFGLVDGSSKFARDHDMESMWNFAVDLEMPLLANYCMRLLVAKYSYGLGAIHDGRPALLLWDAPYEVHGPLDTLLSNKRSSTRNKLLRFMEDLIRVHGPLSQMALALASDQYNYTRGWIGQLLHERGFRAWIIRLGGLWRDDRNGELPTDYANWHKYMFSPGDAVQEAAAEYTGPQHANGDVGREVSIVASTKRKSDQDFSVQWTFGAANGN